MLDQRQVPVSFFFLFNLFHSFFLARGTLMFTSSLLVSTPRRCLHACYPALRHTLATLCAKKKFFLNDTNSHFNFFFKKYNWKLSYVNRFWSSPQNQYQRHSISTTKLAISISQPKKKKKKLLRVVKDDSNSLFFLFGAARLGAARAGTRRRRTGAVRTTVASHCYNKFGRCSRVMVRMKKKKERKENIYVYVYIYINLKKLN